MTSRPQPPSPDRRSEIVELSEAELAAFRTKRNAKLRKGIIEVLGTDLFGRHVHPSEMGEPGTFIMAPARTGFAQHYGHRMELIDAEGVRRSVTIVREENCLRWLTIEGRETYRPTFWQRDVYDLLMESYPWVADTAEQAIQVFMNRYGVVAPSVVNPWAAKRLLLWKDSSLSRWQEVFSERHGVICEGCEACETAPEWFIHRLFDR